jgi:hypothetical protein
MRYNGGLSNEIPVEAARFMHTVYGLHAVTVSLDRQKGRRYQGL